MAISLSKVAGYSAALVIAYCGLCIALLPYLHWHYSLGGGLSTTEDDVLADFFLPQPCPAGAEPGYLSLCFNGLLFSGFLRVSIQLASQLLLTKNQC
jgi:hypothetical protein